MNRENCCTSFFSFIHSGCREASHFFRCTCICAMSTARNCSYHSQRWFVGWYNFSLSQQLDFMASVQVFLLSKASCWNRLSNSEMGRREWYGQYFYVFTESVTQYAHKNRDSEILILVFGVDCPPLLSCLLNFLLPNLLDGVFQDWRERISKIPLRELQFSSSHLVRCDLLEVY